MSTTVDCGSFTINIWTGCTSAAPSMSPSMRRNFHFANDHKRYAFEFESLSRPERLNILLEARDQLLSFQHYLDDRVRMTRDRVPRSVIYLHMSYQMSQLLIHRPYLKEPPDCSAYHLAMRSVLTAASEIAHLVRVFERQHDNFKTVPPFVVHSVLCTIAYSHFDSPPIYTSKFALLKATDTVPDFGWWKRRVVPRALSTASTRFRISGGTSTSAVIESRGPLLQLLHWTFPLSKSHFKLCSSSYGAHCACPVACVSTHSTQADITFAIPTWD